VRERWVKIAIKIIKARVSGRQRVDNYRAVAIFDGSLFILAL